MVAIQIHGVQVESRLNHHTDKGVHFLSEEKHYNDTPNRFVWNELADSVLLPDGKKAIGMTPDGWVQFYNPKNLAERPTSFFQL